MASLMNAVFEKYNYIFTDLADPRTSDFFLMSSPWPILAITGFYLYFCKSFGPRYMKDRQPYDLKNVILVYNIFQIYMSTYLFYECIVHVSSEKFSFRCAPVDYSDDPAAVRALNGAWWYFFCKVTEFLDTTFFVLRKKDNHVSFLHVYHHSLMALMTWIGVKYLGGGHAIVMGLLNTFVHMVMYTYYLIAGLGPKYQKYIWWKKHVTVLQLVQFVIVLIHNLVPLCSDCTYPKLAHIIMIGNAILFINLFGKFFYASYIKAPTKNGTAKDGPVTNGSSKSKLATNGTFKNGTYTNGTTTEHTNGISLNKKNKDL